MGENFSREVMWRLSANSNSLVDKLMSTFTDDTWRRNKRMTSTILCKSQCRFILDRMRDFEQRSFWKMETSNVLPKLPFEVSLKIDILSPHTLYPRCLFVSDLMLSVSNFSFIIVGNMMRIQRREYIFEKKLTHPFTPHFSSLPHNILFYILSIVFIL